MKSAVLVIDLQIGLFKEDGNPFDFNGVIQKINKITLFARKGKLPVIFIQHEKNGSELEFNSLEWNLVPDLHREASAINTDYLKQFK